MNVLSLCDGMSCGQIALKECGITIDKYFAAEIKEIGIEVTKANFPSTIFIGDVNKISYKNGVLYTENGEYPCEIDLVMFGSPCQTFSACMKKELRNGLKNKEKSGLFLECHRILQEVNPKWFFIENVASMKKEDRNTLSGMIGREPYNIDAADFSPCHRKRLYWTNIPFTLKDKSNITLNDILCTGYSPRQKGTCLLVSDARPLRDPIKMFFRYEKHSITNLIFIDEKHYLHCKEYYYSKYSKQTAAKDLDVTDPDNKVFNGLRYLSQEELEKVQGVPTGYTKCLTRNQAADVLGDGWQIDVIKMFFNNLKG